MIPKPFDQIEFADIQELVDNHVQERRTLEYKQSLPSGSEDDKREFLADVSSFANAAGGDVLYGIGDSRDQNGKPTGIPDKVVGLSVANCDSEILRLESIIRDGIQPRIAGVHIRSVPGCSNGPVLLIRIRKSYAAPHMVTFKNLSRFFSRSSAGKYQLNVPEIRSAFALSEMLPERIRRFRDERLARVVANEGPAVLADGPKLVLHLLPISAFNGIGSVDIELAAKESSGLRPLLASSCDFRYNIDGVLTFRTVQNSGTCQSYVQLFRTGSLEAVSSQFVADQRAAKLFPAWVIESDLIARTRDFLSVFKRLQIATPVVLMLSLLGVRGHYIPGATFGDHPASFDRDDLFLPDVLVEDIENPTEAILRPVFDAMWQASGWRKCFNYDETGQRVNSGRFLVAPN